MARSEEDLKALLSEGVTFLGDPAKGGAGRHVLFSLSKCKAKSDSWTFGAGGVSKGKFDGLALDYEWAK